MVFNQAYLNFDYNATAPLWPEVKDELFSFIEKGLKGNPSSVHSVGRKARALIENSRETIANFLRIKSDQIIFTSGATEANNMALKGFKGNVIVSAIEHLSVLNARPDAFICKVNDQGEVDLSSLEEMLLTLSLKDEPILVSIMLANNETGILQPFEEISKLCRKYKAYFHTDAVQAFLKISFDSSLFDMISLSAHKIGGVEGVGCLVISKNVPFKPLIMGGGQERSLRAGTENILGILSFAKACEVASQFDWSLAENHIDIIQKELSLLGSDINFIGLNVKRLPNTLCISMPNVKAETQVMRFDLEGIAVSAGSACSSGKVKTISHVLKAMRIPESVAMTTLRMSVSSHLTENERDHFIHAWKKIYNSTVNLQQVS